METCRQVQAAADARGYALTVVGVPKTVDNDIVGTDCCPGYGSAAKYLATSVREVGLDLAAMTTNAGRAFVLEVMGRNAGWLAAACGLAAEDDSAAPHLILLPRCPSTRRAFSSGSATPSPAGAIARSWWPRAAPGRRADPVDAGP
jgi:6-phosphofructokinase 1